ncbi:MAG: ABC-F family ATP-binding cassette domain-containing protein [Verrucomicrobiota bacterium]|nr:ABC-F family ATP-binding cassette domain-containing protein [Verrucomicrobiota bacterium]
MLTISSISKSFGGRELFTEASLQVNRGDRIGLVGPNGAGKSTLFSLILGINDPDEGSISMERKVTLGFLPQETAPAGEESILDLALSVNDEMKYLREQLARTEEDAEHHDAINRYHDLEGNLLETKAKRLLKGLAFRETDFNRPARELSGGWVMRAHLARLLVMEPDLLMLDEPTNHLDLESLNWFQNYLMSYPGAIFMISHDREFLNTLVDDIVEVAYGRLTRYRGNYESYVEQRAARREQQLSAYKNQQKEIAALQEFADRFRAKASKATQAQSKLKQIERMVKIEMPPDESSTIKFQFPQPRRSGEKVMTLNKVDFAYGPQPVYQNLNLEISKGQRMVLVGPNGAGKSTMLKLLAGVLTPASGVRQVGHNVDVGYFAQNRSELLQSNATVLQSVRDSPKPVSEEVARTILGAFLFRGDDVFKTVKVLSGGEKSRLNLVKLLLDPPNFLLMDEPTTHLDMPSIEALIFALEQYTGTVVFISHDVYFIRKIAASVMHISAGIPTYYPGDYQYYLDKTNASSARSALVAGDKLANQSAISIDTQVTPRVSVFKTKEQKRAEAEARQAISRQRKETTSAYERYEQQIHQMENRVNSITDEMGRPEIASDGKRMVDLNRELSDLHHKLHVAMTEWEALGAQLVAFKTD